MISYCIPVKNRAHHLKKTLIWNYSRAPRAQFVVVNYDSSDDLDSFMHGRVFGNIKYIRMPDRPNYDEAHANNVAHRYADGEIVVNLAADNFIESGFCEHLLSKLATRGCIVTAPKGSIADVSGRIAMRKADFEMLGGFDESFNGWGGSDQDLIRRAMFSGFRIERWDEVYGSAIAHSNAERVENFSEKDQWISNAENLKKSDENIHAGRFVANVGKVWGGGVVEIEKL